MFAVGGGERSATTSERLVVLECLPTTLQALFGLILDDEQPRSNLLKLALMGLAPEGSSNLTGKKPQAQFPKSAVILRMQSHPRSGGLPTKDLCNLPAAPYFRRVHRSFAPQRNAGLTMTSQTNVTSNLDCHIPKADHTREANPPIG